MSFITILLLLGIASLSLVAVFTIRSIRRKYRQMPIVTGIFDEKHSNSYGNRGEKGRESLADKSVYIKSLTARLNEIEEKIKVVQVQQISEDAKRIIIQELEEEKRRIEEEMRKTIKSGSE